MIRRGMLWAPAFIAVVFLAVSSIAGLVVVGETRTAVIANLFNTCESADVIRPQSSDECWERYTEVSGHPRPASAGSTAP